MNSKNKLFDPPADFVPDDGHADWNEEDVEPDVEEFLHNEDFDHELGAQAAAGVEDAVRDLTEQETQDFLKYIDPTVRAHFQEQAMDPNEDAQNPGQGPQYQQLIDARELIAERSAGLSEQEQHFISQRMSLAMSVFQFDGEGAVFMDFNVLDAIMYGTNFLSAEKITENNVSIHIPLSLPEKTKELLTKAVNYLLSIPDATYWKNMAIATRKIGLTPLDGCIFMNVTY